MLILYFIPSLNLTPRWQLLCHMIYHSKKLTKQINLEGNYSHMCQYKKNLKAEDQLYKFPSQAAIKRITNQTQASSKQIMRTEIKFKIKISQQSLKWVILKF